MSNKTIIALSILFIPLVGISGSAFKEEFSQERCGLPHENEIQNAVKVPGGYKTSEEIRVLSQKIYTSSQRLANRAWYDPTMKKLYAYYLKEKIAIPSRLIKSVTAHIERTLAEGYAEEVILSDMGHAHMLIPLDVYRAKDRTGGMGKVLSFFYGHTKTKFLYHTAEHLKIWDEEEERIPINPYLQQRYYTRNVIADNSGSSEIRLAQNPDNLYNTVRSYPGHRYISGFDISANKGGCFPFYDKNNNIRYFDISPMGHYPLGHHPALATSGYSSEL